MLRRLYKLLPTHARQSRPQRLALVAMEDRTVPATFVVTNTADAGAGSLRAAVMNANSNPGDDTITFVPGLGTIELTSGALLFTESTGKTTVTGPATGTQVIARNPSAIAFTIVDVRASRLVTLSNLTIRGGFHDLGGGIHNRGELKIDSCTITNNTASEYGGGIYNGSDSQLTVVNTTITDNFALTEGGGVFNYSMLMTMTSSVVSKNQAGNYGGGIANYGKMSGSFLTVAENTTKYAGGGIQNGREMILTESLISGNAAISSNGSAASLGGGIANGQSAVLNVSSTEFKGNAADDGGGLSSSGSVSVVNCQFVSNTAFNGGGMSGHGTRSIVGSLFSKNTATDNGGGVFSYGESLTIEGSTFSQNTGKFGGGIFNQGDLTVTQSTFSGNLATIGGGAITGSNGKAIIAESQFVGGRAQAGGGIANQAEMKINNCMFTQNETTVDGGAIYTYVIGQTTVVNSTIHANKSSLGGGIGNEGRVTVTGSTISGNTATNSGGGIGNRTGGVVSLSETTLTGNTSTNAGGGLYSFGGQVTMTKSQVTQNTAVNAGGIGVNGFVSVSDSSISFNTVTGSGGGLMNFSGTAEISKSQFKGNQAIFNAGIQNQGTMTVTDTTITDNKAKNTGGGLGSLVGSTTLTNVQITGNTAQYTGGIYNKVDMTIVNSVISQNHATLESGGLFNSKGQLTMTRTQVFENTATIGGGVGNSGTMTVTESSIRENIASTMAGGIMNYSGSLSISSSTIAGNSANDGAGGILNQDLLTLGQSTISGNTAVNDGGGLANNGGKATIVNSTISGNQAKIGGGINVKFDEAEAVVTVVNCTITMNTATEAGGGINNVNGTVMLTNSIVALNLVGSTPNDFSGALVGTSQHNLIGVDTNLTGITDGSQGNRLGTTASPINPRLTALANHGGPTLTHALLINSPAANKGSNAEAPSTDQHGNSRIVAGTVDLGAVESNWHPTTLVGFREFSVGADVGSGTVTLFNSDGSVRFSLNPFGDFTGGIRTAAADFTGDGVADLVAATGPGRATSMRIFDGATQTEIFTLDPFEAAFKGGLFVATGDVNGDGTPDFVISPDEGGGPRVRIFSGNGFSQIADFFGIDDPNFRGGARASVGDLNGDGKGDLLVAAGFGGGPRMAAYDGARLGSNGGPKLFGDFFAFEQSLRNGTFIAAGDVNGDGFADMVAGGGPGGGPRVYILDGKTLTNTGTITPIGNFFAGNVNSRGGIRVSVKDLDGDSKADLLVGAGTGAGSRVTAYRGSQIAMTSGTPPELFAFDASVGALDGVFVG